MGDKKRRKRRGDSSKGGFPLAMVYGVQLFRTFTRLSEKISFSECADCPFGPSRETLWDSATRRDGRVH